MLPLLAFAIIRIGLYFNLDTLLPSINYSDAARRLRTGRFHISVKESQSDEVSQRLLSTAHNDSSLAKVLQLYGGPICKDHIDARLAHSCPHRICGEYNLWYDDVYRNIQPPSISPAFQSSHYYQSAFAKRNVSGRKVVISIGHNGLGQELYQHYFAQRVAEEVHAYLFVSSWEEIYGHSRPDPNAARWQDLAAMDPLFMWHNLPPDHPARTLCSEGNMSYSKRPVDIRSRGKGKDGHDFDARLRAFLLPAGGTDCLITTGFFHHKETCADTVRRMWPGLSNRDMLHTYAPPVLPLGPRDMVIPFSCQSSFLGECSHSLV